MIADAQGITRELAPLLAGRNTLIRRYIGLHIHTMKRFTGKLHPRHPPHALNLPLRHLGQAAQRKQTLG